jgi:hypothetical protein
MAGATKYWIMAAVALASPLAAPTAVRAQEAAGAPITTGDQGTNALDSDTYDRGRNVGVLDRQRPDYQAIGFRAGGFTIFPKVTLTGVYDDNVLAAQNGAVGDFIFDVAPEIAIQSNWSRNSLSAYVRLDQDAYARLSSQDTTQYGAGVAGKLQFGDASSMVGGVDYGHFVLPRSVSNNFGASSHPIPYDYVALNDKLTAQFTRFRLSLKIEDLDYRYQNGTTSGGTVVFLQNESHNDAILTGKAEFALSPDAAVYVQAQGNYRGYQLAPPVVPFTLTSSGYQVSAGANFDITHLIRGEFELGYLSQTYVSPLFKPVQGLAGKAQIEWFPTQLTTVTFLASREIGDSQVVGSAGYIGSKLSARVDHELLRNLILSGDLSAGYAQNIGIDRNDTLLGAAFSARWLITRHVGVTFAYAYSDQRSVGTAAGPVFVDNRGTVSLVLQL